MIFWKISVFDLIWKIRKISEVSLLIESLSLQRSKWATATLMTISICWWQNLDHGDNFMMLIPVSHAKKVFKMMKFCDENVSRSNFVSNNRHQHRCHLNYDQKLWAIIGFSLKVSICRWELKFVVISENPSI